MCFSAESSFAASAGLAVVGVATLSQVDRRNRLLLGLVPLFFAVQQFAEGIIWTRMPYNPAELMSFYAAHVYVFFAFLFWPTFAPLAFWLAEEDKRRQRPLLMLSISGGLLSTLFLLHGLFGGPLQVVQVGHSLSYWIAEADKALPIAKWLYVATTAGAALISSLHYVSVFGGCTVLAFFAAAWFFSYAFTSVWCFFAAIISLSLYGVLKVNRTDV